MIIDTTCSVMEQKMKEVPEAPEKPPTFKVSDFKFESISASYGSPVCFDWSGWSSSLSVRNVALDKVTWTDSAEIKFYYNID